MSEKPAVRPLRADAQRNNDALLKAALAVFATSGVDAPVREIAERAGVGIGTVYRRFPRRSDLIVAVLRNEVDACADAAFTTAAEYKAGDALERWLQRLVDFIATKRGLAAALHSGDPAFDALPDYLEARLGPALKMLLEAAISAGDVRAGADADDLLQAVASFSHGRHGGPAYARRMVALLLDGLRYSAKPASGD
jgi:AcrR family transcriptional regulator